MPAAAQQPVAPGGPPPRVTAVRAETAVRIDGVADDAVWQRAQAVRDFRQYDPELDAAPTQATEFRVAYNAHDLYVFVRAYDARPDSILRALSRRDVRGPSDQVGIYIDSYHDRRTGYSFFVNPDGVKRDFAIYNDGNQDASWNGVWEVATQVDGEGWTAEFRIPFSQLRYAEGERHTFGFGVRRTVERYPESAAWPAYSRVTPGLMSQLGTLDGLQGLGSANRIEATPYVVARSATRPMTEGGFEQAQHLDVGGDLKVGLTPNVTLDATVNPDFGQVEADPAVLNLSAFETFLSERRPFFMEGTGLYTFQLNCYIVVDCSTNEGLFYSRRIGKRPSLDNLYGSATTPAATPIRGAAKLTGRTSGGLAFGVLEAVTGEVSGAGERTMEPRTNYAVARATQDLRGGDTGVGLILTAVNRAESEWTEDYLHRSAYVVGGNARTRFGDRNWEVAAAVAASRVAGTPAAIARTMRNSVHYFQRPEGGLEFDPEATSMSGWSGQLKVGKYGGGITRIETSLVRQSPGFEVNDLGYLRRADITDWSTWGALTFQQPTAVFRWAQVNGNTWHHWNTDGTRIQSAVNANGHMGLHNNWDVHLGGTVEGLGGPLCDRCTRGGPLLRSDVGFFPWGGVNSDSRRTVSGGIWFNGGRWDGGRSFRVSLSPSLALRASTRMTAQLGVNVTDAEHNTQWFANVTGGAGGTHHVFAHLDQRTLSLTLRLNYTMTRDLTLEVYGEPFTTSGTWSDMRELSADPTAAAYEDRFQPYTPGEPVAETFKFDQLRTNTVVRWEYAPGSTLFLVWAHGREAFTEDVTRGAWHHDVRDLWELHPDHTFLVKLAYWFNR